MTEAVPEHYRLHLIPDLGRLDFQGEAEIRFAATEPVSQVCLNVLELAVWRCRLLDGDAGRDCPFRLDPAAETLTVTLPAAQEGPFLLRIDYQGRIGDRMAGFYRSRFTGGGGGGILAVTQFQESDARRAFPCRDHPGSKAVFEITVTAGDETVLSNQEVLDSVRLPDGRTAVRFAPTPPMSAYLVFFGLGPFEVTPDDRDRRVRVVTLPGHSARGAFGRDFGRRSLAWCESYFGIPYPLSKLDLIAVPDFAFGAMENWGAITFRENLLLHDPRTTSRLAETRICEVIAHEIVHQWFGNLVTPADWKYLWLNESFATYGAYRAVDHHHPEWDMWQQFIHTQTAPALERDGLGESPAIEIPGGEHVVINTSTAPVIYSKGGSLLRQIEGYIGSEAFRRGMRRYLETHAYASAHSHHLWEAFEAAGDKPVSRMVQAWVAQPGHPLVSVRREGDTLLLDQRRFDYRRRPSNQLWPIPVTVRAFDAEGRSRRLATDLETASGRLDLPPGTTAFKLNDGQTGFYRVRYLDPAELNRLAPLAVAGRLEAADRWGLQNDLFAMVRSGRAALTDFLDWLERCAGETQLLPVLGAAANLRLALLAAGEAERGAVADAAARLGAAQLERLGPAPVEGEPMADTLVREQMIGLGLIGGATAVREEMAPAVRRLFEGAPTHPDLLQATLQAAAVLEGEAALAWFQERLETTDSEHERVAVLTAMGAFADGATAHRALDWVVTRVPQRNRYVPIAAAAGNPWLAGGLWAWFQEHRADLETMHPLLYERVLAAVIPVPGLAAPPAVREFCRDYRRRHPALAAVIDLSLERLAVNEAMRRAEGAEEPT